MGDEHQEKLKIIKEAKQKQDIEEEKRIKIDRRGETYE